MNMRKAKKIVKGRFKYNIHFLKSVLKANSFVIDTIENGYKIPLFSKPLVSFSPNNWSALADPDFVNDAVSSLLYRGLIQSVRKYWNQFNSIPATRAERLKQSVNELLSKQGRHVHMLRLLQVSWVNVFQWAAS